MHDRLKLAREQAGFETAVAAALRFGWNETTYRHHENGIRNFPKPKAVIYGRAFRVSPEWLLLGVGVASKKPVPLVGYVGAGDQVFETDDGGSLSDIDPPPGVGPEAVAVVVRGDSMWPRYSDGDMIIYDCHIPLHKGNRRECVIGLQDGRRMVKRLRLVEGTDMVILESHNAGPLEVKASDVMWVAPIAWVRRA